MLRVLAEDKDENDSLLDITLIGTDGGRVPAIKAILALRSPVWKRMFFGNFQERECKTVEFNYPSLVLKVLVKYCFTDELDLDLFFHEDNNNEDEEDDNGVLSDEEAVLMIQLRDAANYFELSELRVIISNEIGESIRDDDEMKCVCAILNEMLLRGRAEDPMWNMLEDMVQSYPDACLLSPSKLNKGILACSSELVLKLLSLPTMNAFCTAQSLQKWWQHQEEVEQQQQVLEESLVEELKNLAHSIKLESMSSQQLAHIQPCPLFSVERLHQAFVQISKKQPVGNDPTTSSKFKTTVALVSGAGVTCMNGTYFRTSFPPFQYTRTGKYGNMKSTFRLRFHDEENQWQVVVENGSTFCNPPNYKSLVMYQATAPCPSRNEVPFAFWNCSDEISSPPAPYVNIIQAARVVSDPAAARAAQSTPEDTESIGAEDDEWE